MAAVRALLVADRESEYIWDHFDRAAFAGVDVIVSCGDLKGSYLSFLTTMVAAPLLYVPGNHDQPYLQHPPEGCEDLTEKMAVVKGVRFLGFGGCNSRSPKPFHYEEKDVGRQIARRIPEVCRHGGFDVLVTHAPALGLGDGDDSFHRGFAAYRALLDHFTPAYHFHGHNHPGYSSAKRQLMHGATAVVNAYGHLLLDLQADGARGGRLSYLRTRYDWGRAYAEKP